MTSEREIARTVVNRVAVACGLPVPWPCSDAALPDWLQKADVSGWGVVELGEMRLALADTRQRELHGQVYTPVEVAEFMARSTFDSQLPKLADARRPLEHITVHDPFVGCGIYPIFVARHIARWCLDRLGATPAEHAEWMGPVTATVLEDCVYGNDLDVVAVDIARAACWLEVGGDRPITFMDANITVGDTFLNQLPPKLLARWPLEVAS